jgi:HAD superfamily hydrolase (TIGR01509 family)
MQHQLLTQIRAVIFDMDGLMLDTEPLYKIAWQRAAVDCGHPISEELYARLIGRTRIAGEEILRNQFGTSFSLDRFRDACARREAAAFAETLPSMKPGLKGLLDFLEARGISLAVATSTERPIAHAQLGGHGLLPRFSTVTTGDEVVNGKPSPDLFLLTAERLAVEPVQCLVLEDSEAGVMAAHRAGMRVDCVPDNKAPSPVEALADARFQSLEEVTAHLTPPPAPSPCFKSFTSPGAPARGLPATSISIVPS